MPRNGSGTFNRIYSWEQDAANNIKIRADRMDAEMDGMATALTNSIAVDGQTDITANLPMSGFKHTNVDDATEDDEYVALGQIGAAGFLETGNQVGQIPLNYSAPLAATDGGTDVFQFDAGGDISDGDVLTLTIPAANSTASPTLDNTGGLPTGARDIVTTAGAAFIGMLEARAHRFEWRATPGEWVVLDPAGGVVEKGSNANGEYVIWGDGSMICEKYRFDITGISTSASTHDQEIDFPAQFSGDVSVTVNLERGAGSWDSGNDRMSYVTVTPRSSSFDLLLFRGGGSNFGGTFGQGHFIAKGTAA